MPGEHLYGRQPVGLAPFGSKIPNTKLIMELPEDSKETTAKVK